MDGMDAMDRRNTTDLSQANFVRVSPDNFLLRLESMETKEDDLQAQREAVARIIHLNNLMYWALYGWVEKGE